MLSCEAHRCQQVCHSGPCQPCPRSPSLVKTCPCSQTPLTKLLELGYSERRSCTDPIPSCGKTCNKPLPCGSNGEEKRCRHFLWHLKNICELQPETLNTKKIKNKNWDSNFTKLFQRLGMQTDLGVKAVKICSSPWSFQTIYFSKIYCVKWNIKQLVTIQRL